MPLPFLPFLDGESSKSARPTEAAEKEEVQKDLMLFSRVAETTEVGQ